MIFFKKTILLLQCLIVGIFSWTYALNIRACPSFDPNFHDQWNHLALEAWPSLSSVDSAYFGEPIFIYTIYSDFSIRKDSTANVKMSIKVIDPKGNEFLKKKNIEVIKGKVLRDDMTMLAKSGITLGIPRSAGGGDYKVIISAKDKIERQWFNDTAIIKVIETIPVYEFKNDSLFLSWIENYYKSPNPKSAISAFDYYLKSELLSNDSLFRSIFYFFDLLVQNNPFLGDEIIKKAQKEGKEYQTYVAMLLNIIKWDTDTLLKSLPLASRKIIFSEMDNINPIITFIYKLDPNPIIYSFYYSGNYETLKMFAESMWSRDTDSLPDSMICDKCSTEESKNAIKEKKYYSIAKSVLLDLYNSHSLVRGYLNFMYANEDLKPIVREEIGKIIEQN